MENAKRTYEILNSGEKDENYGQKQPIMSP